MAKNTKANYGELKGSKMCMSVQMDWILKMIFNLNNDKKRYYLNNNKRNNVVQNHYSQ